MKTLIVLSFLTISNFALAGQSTFKSFAAGLPSSRSGLYQLAIYDDQLTDGSIQSHYYIVTADPNGSLKIVSDPLTKPYLAEQGHGRPEGPDGISWSINNEDGPVVLVETVIIHESSGRGEDSLEIFHLEAGFFKSLPIDSALFFHDSSPAIGGALLGKGYDRSKLHVEHGSSGIRFFQDSDTEDLGSFFYSGRNVKVQFVNLVTYSDGTQNTVEAFVTLIYSLKIIEGKLNLNLESTNVSIH